MEISTLPDLASRDMGGAVVAASDEFFASKENLVNPDPPQYREGEYTERGKWMDGWETRRRRDDGHDWCIVRLGAPAVLRGAVVDTSHFAGNYPDGFSLEVKYSDRVEVVEEGEWQEVVPRTPLEGDKVARFEMPPTSLATHVRFNIYPDGGVARLRLHGHAVPDWLEISAGGQIDLAAAANGAVVLDCSDRFFSQPAHMTLSGPSKGMWDGWETRRRRGPGHDWAIIKLAAAATPQRIVVDTSHFHGNSPGWCWLDGLDARFDDEPQWKEVVAESAVVANHANEYEVAGLGDPVTHVRLNIKPDGGVARLRVMGEVDADELRAKTLQRFNLMSRQHAVAEMLAVCASGDWASRVAAGRPYRSFDQLIARAVSAWEALGPEAWLEASAAHPRIGENPDAAAGRSSRWSAAEQSAASRPSAAVARRLRTGQRRYEERFGRGYLVAAHGRSGEEIVADLEDRLANEPEEELAVTAEQQSLITERRLRELFVTLETEAQ